MKKVNLFLLLLIFNNLLTAQTTNLIFHLPFNGNSIDETGNGNNAMNNGAILTTDRNDFVNSAYYFDGVDDFMEIVPISDLSQISDFTFSCWTKFDSWTYPGIPQESMSDIEESKYIFNGHSRSSTASTDFYRDGFNIIAARDINNNEFLNTGTVYTYNPITYYRTINNFQNISDWKHIVYKRENGVFTTYINGVIADISFTNGTINLTSNLDMMHSLFIGTFSGNNPNIIHSGAYNYKGKIDDIRFYTTSLSEENILRLYNEDNYISMNITGIVTNEKIEGSENGRIDITVTGGFAPYVYIWDNGSNNQDIVDLASNTYTVTVIDALGFKCIKSFDVLRDGLSISGNVLAEIETVQNARVILYEKINSDYTIINELYSTNLGYFIFDNLNQGEYTIQAFPNSDFEDYYIPTFYYQSTTIENCINLSLSGDISHLEMQLININQNVDDIENSNLSFINNTIQLNGFRHFIIYSNNGKILQNGYKNIIDINDYSPGVYFVSIMEDKKQISFKVIKK